VENNHDKCKAQSFTETLSARQPFPTACLRKKKEKKKHKTPATYRDPSWQLSKKTPQLHSGAFRLARIPHPGWMNTIKTASAAY